MGFLVKEDPVTGTHCCPWWMGYLIDNPIRRLIDPPKAVLGDLVKPGMTVLDYGCGFGHFAMGLADLVESDGHVIVVDIQKQALDKTMKRARGRGVERRLTPVLVGVDALAEQDSVDFALAANVVHEVPDKETMLSDIRTVLKPGGLFLMIEPKGHVSSATFQAEKDLVIQAGFEGAEREGVKRSLMALFTRMD